MAPDFSTKTIAVLAKRGAFYCSNPDCRALTVGPNADPDKATVLGEAAHIYGARPDSARYDARMTDAARAEITNAIWLCRNCHKKVDSDSSTYPGELLFLWREQHDHHVAKLGGFSELARLEIRNEHLKQLEAYPPLIRRIALDSPPGWEWRFTAELMRHLNAPSLRRLEDLRNGLLVQKLEHIADEDVLRWTGERAAELSRLISPLERLFDELTKSWGEAGEAGDLDEIHHMCGLVRDYMEVVVAHEERIAFANVSEEFKPLVTLLRDFIGSQAAKIGSVPGELDDFVTRVLAEGLGNDGEPVTVTLTITIETPDRWVERWNRELRKAEPAFRRSLAD